MLMLRRDTLTYISRLVALSIVFGMPFTVFPFAGYAGSSGTIGSAWKGTLLRGGVNA